MKDKDIVSLYKKSATETPSKELDKQILDYAKANSKKPFQYRHLVALAASIGLITLLAPWRWYESTEHLMPDEDHLNIKSRPDTIQAESMAPAKERMEMMSDRGRKSIMSEKSQALNISPSDIDDQQKLQEIEMLLKTGNKEQAKKMLEQFLKEKPEIRNKLSDQLNKLQSEENRE